MKKSQTSIIIADSSTISRLGLNAIINQMDGFDSIKSVFERLEFSHEMSNVTRKHIALNAAKELDQSAGS